jgi:DNA repair photolyase
MKLKRVETNTTLRDLSLKNMNHKIKKVISASRRVDLLTFYPDYSMKRLEEIGKENIHTLVIWTKNPRNILENKNLRRYLKSIDQIYLLLTVTGLGGTPLEPGVPEPERVLKTLPDLVDFSGSPLRIAMRYDPLIDVIYDKKVHLSNIELAFFQKVLDTVKQNGIKRIISSYVTVYPKVKRRLDKYNFQIIDHPLSEIKNFLLKKMIPQTKKLGMELSTCVLPAITKNGCIDGDLLTELHPQKEPCSTVKDKTQRASCYCTKSVDIGMWFPCYHNCTYCYGNPTR